MRGAWATASPFNYGVRWEPYLGQQMLYGGANIFNHDNFVNNIKSQVFVNAPAGLLYPGDAGFPKGKSAYNTKWLDVSPRLGLAWDVTGGRAPRVPHVVRADIRLSERRLHEHQRVGAAMGQPLAHHDDRLRRPVLGRRRQPASDRDQQRTRVYPAFGAFGVMDPNISPRACSRGTSRSRSSSGTNWSATVNYLGRYSDHLWAEEALNPGVFMGTGPCTLNGVA